MCKSEMREEKTLKAYEEDWNYLHELKRKYKFKKVADIINLFNIHCREAISKGDLNLINQEK